MAEVSRRELIEKLWAEHHHSTLPPECRGVTISGIALEELDAEASNTIDAVLRAGRFTHERHIVLAVCRDKLSRIMPGLDPEGRTHFYRLKHLSLLLIEEFS
jgi:hypothetical protein